MVFDRGEWRIDDIIYATLDGEATPRAACSRELAQTIASAAKLKARGEALGMS
jgi:hypothetical protein